MKFDPISLFKLHNLNGDSFFAFIIAQLSIPYNFIAPETLIENRCFALLILNQLRGLNEFYF